MKGQDNRVPNKDKIQSKNHNLIALRKVNRYRGKVRTVTEAIVNKAVYFELSPIASNFLLFQIIGANKKLRSFL